MFGTSVRAAHAWVFVKAAPSGLGEEARRCRPHTLPPLMRLGRAWNIRKLGRPNRTAPFWPEGIAFSDHNLLDIVERDHGLALAVFRGDDSMKGILIRAVPEAMENKGTTRAEWHARIRAALHRDRTRAEITRRHLAQHDFTAHDMTRPCRRPTRLP
jgi:hypothetical protein